MEYVIYMAVLTITITQNQRGKRLDLVGNWAGPGNLITNKFIVTDQTGFPAFKYSLFSSCWWVHPILHKKVPFLYTELAFAGKQVCLLLETRVIQAQKVQNPIYRPTSGFSIIC